MPDDFVWITRMITEIMNAAFPASGMFVMVSCAASSASLGMKCSKYPITINIITTL